MRTKTFFFSLFACFAIIAFVSCGNCSKKIDCPGYKDDTLDSWFSYHDNQQLIFLSNTNQQDTFSLKKTLTTQPYTATGGGFAPGPYCEAQKVFEAAEIDSLKHTKLRIELSSTNSNRIVNYSFGNYYIYFSNFSDTGAVSISFTTRYGFAKTLTNATIGNRIFPKVFEVIGDTSTNKNPGLYKIYYAKGEGLVSYSEYPSLKTWTKQ